MPGMDYYDKQEGDDYYAEEDALDQSQNFHTISNGFEFDRTQFYCLKRKNTHIRDASSLPNDRCCPFKVNSVAEARMGIPYSTTIHGCCEKRLYDLKTQYCCEDNTIINLDKEPESVSSINYSQTGADSVDLTWEPAFGASNYRVFLIKIFEF